MGEVRCLRQQFGDPEIPYLDLVVPREEHVDRLDVSMEDLVRVEVLEAETHLKEELPDVLLREHLAHLALEELTEISLLAELHNDVDVTLLSEGVIVLDYVGAVDARQNSRLVHGLLSHLRAHLRGVDLLQHVCSLVV